jgi:predicted enzyme related to lactoylglutathione lyase
MEGKFLQIALVVTDQTRSLEFFTKKVGFEKRTDFTPPGRRRWVTVSPPGEQLEMALFELGTPVDPAQQEWAKTWSPGRAPPVVLRVADCRKIYEELHARGVEFLQAPEDYPWGTAATFKDPDGNLFSISQPPTAWPKK